MKTVLLITTILIGTPDKDFTGMLIEELRSMVDCNMKLKNHEPVDMEFDGILTIKVKHKCEVKKWTKHYSIKESVGLKTLSTGVITTNQNGE